MSKVTGVIADEIHEQDMYIEEKELVFRLSNVPIPLSKTIIEKSNFHRHFTKDNAPVKWKMVNFNCAMSEDRTKYYVKIYLYDVQRVHRLDLLSCWGRNGALYEESHHDAPGHEHRRHLAGRLDHKIVVPPPSLPSW